MTQTGFAVLDHVRARWLAADGQRSFMLGATFLLALAAMVFRGVILAGDFPDAGPLTRFAWLLNAARDDFLVVGALLAVGLVVGPILPGRRLRRGWGWIWFGLALGILILGFVNVFAVRILGGPVVRDWILYSDIGNTDVILDSVFFLATPLRLLALSLLVACFLFGAVFLHRASRAALVARGLLALGVSVAILPLFMPAGAMGVRDGKLANPARALLASYLGPDELILPGGDLVGAPRLEPPDLGVAAPIPRPEAAPGTIRNVIVLAIDAVSSRYVEGFDGRYPITPNIRRYQAQGMRFMNAYAHVPASNFFLVSLLAGMVPELSRESMTITQDAPDLHTLSEAVAARGFRTGFFNSSDNRFQNTEAFVRAAGFQQIQDYRDWQCAHGVYESRDFADQFLNTSNDHCTVAAIESWILEAPQDPFLVVMRTGMSHYPYYPGEDPQRFAEDDTLNDYLNAIHVSDAAFGRLMGFLEAQGLAETTLVVVLGDHGEAFGEHGTFGHASGIHEENVHVPLLFVNPLLFSGQGIEQIVGLSELAPTIADLLGMPPSPYWQARSLFAPGRADGVFFFSPWNGFPIGFRQGTRKFIYSANSGESWLFDLASDPGETENLAPQSPEADAQARGLVADWIAYHSYWVARTLGRGSAQGEAAVVPEGRGELVLYASGTSFLSPPLADIYLDGEYVGRAAVDAAPKNGDAPAMVEQVAVAVTPFRFDIPEIRCASRIEIRFINDEWEGEGQTGDTDLYVAGLDFAGRSYTPAEMRAITRNAGGSRQGYFVLWRNGTAALDLFLPPGCVAERLAASDPQQRD